ncbi:MAG: hypothetical protein JKY56_23625 [Kofleriaceae bacterium]|nr:hypothetical protein [Kofleriaceae bacterium]
MSSGKAAWLLLLLMSVMGCDPVDDGAATDAASSGASRVQGKAWLLYGVADDGASIVTRIWRSRPPPANLGLSNDLNFLITDSMGSTAEGRALVTNHKHAQFSEVDGPAGGYHWDAESTVVWIPIGDAHDQATVSLTSAGMEVASFVVPSKIALHSSHIVEEISVTGAPESRINIVIIGDGYTANEAAKFQSDSDAIANFLLSTRPYNEYRNLFNIHRIITESAESGADHPDLGIDVINRFGSSFNCGGIPRSLCANDSLVFSVVLGHLPETDQVLVLVNDDRYGGAGGQVATTSTHASSPYIAVHEFGHTLAGLADEYETATGNRPIIAPEANVSLSSELGEIKWSHWIEDGTMLPTRDAFATSNVEPIGAYEGARYHSIGIFRPAPACKMRESESELCAVCVEESVRRFHSQSSLISQLRRPLAKQSTSQVEQLLLSFKLS